MMIAFLGDMVLPFSSMLLIPSIPIFGLPVFLAILIARASSMVIHFTPIHVIGLIVGTIYATPLLLLRRKPYLGFAVSGLFLGIIVSMTMVWIFPQVSVMASGILSGMGGTELIIDEALAENWIPMFTTDFLDTYFGFITYKSQSFLLVMFLVFPLVGTFLLSVLPEGLIYRFMNRKCHRLLPQVQGFGLLYEEAT